MHSLIHHSVAAWAEKTPNSIAFRCRDQQISYEVLFKRSAQLANRLIEYGLKAGGRVGILVGKQIELPIATYGIMTAGGAYVPIDPNAPVARVEFILQNCGIEILITDESKRPFIEAIVASKGTNLRHVIGISANSIPTVNTCDWLSIQQESELAPQISTSEGDPAYVMYTSGSTGVPKGMIHTHRSGLAYAKYSSELYQVRPTDVLGNHAPLHFDISTFEFLTGPFSGSTSVLIPEEEMMFPYSLARFIERERLTFWYSVPLALIQMLNRAELEDMDLSSVRWILFGGEPFPPKYLSLLRQAFPAAQIANVYGPAEVNQCTHYTVPSDFSESNGPIPLGEVWAGATGLILDDYDRPSVVGESGELVIASETMMKHYWSRPDLDEKAFFYETEPSGDPRRYYRTGDLVRMSEDGNLQFLGRKDRQIKIRGYRVELDEVEAAFDSHESIEEAAVILVDSAEFEKKLMAFVSIRPNCSFEVKALLHHVRSLLPSYAVPSAVEELDCFPRTTSGKIDRKNLVSS
ncbi:MAG: amino acid adenylation domain-containing protein [Opitutaceae bacterium]